MLKEAVISQIPGERTRRWFTCEEFDLFVFFDGDSIIEFQLSYDKRQYERILVWSRDSGFNHQAVDDGEHAGKHKSSPIFVPDGLFARDSVANQFIKEADAVDPDIRDFVYQKIKEFRL